MAPIEFQAPAATRMKNSTRIACVLFALSMLVGILTPSLAVEFRAILIGLPVFFLLISFPFSIKGYSLSQDGIVIRRLAGNVQLPLESLAAVEGKAEMFDQSFRLAANRGLFVYSGWFWNSEYKLFRAFVSDPSRAVVLKYADRTVVISPHDPQAFIMRARTLMKTQAFRV
jgi:hypothetical protein